MRNRAQKIRLGIFLVVSISVFLFLIIFFTSREFFEKEDVYYVAYENVSVSGLEIGSPVKYLGLKVGTIGDITIDPDNVEKVIVKLSLKPETPIKADAVADITSVGITGLKSIEIRGGSNDAEFLEPGTYIQPGSSITEAITGKAEVIAEKVEKVLNNLQTFTEPDNLNKITEFAESITRFSEQASTTVTRIDSMVAENRSDIRQTISGLKTVTERLNESTKVLASTVIKVQQTVEGDTLGQILGNIRDVSLKLKEADLTTLIDNLAKAAGQTEDLLIKIESDLDRSSQDFSESLHLLRMSLENILDASRKINDDPSILIRGVDQKNTPDDDLNK